MIIDFHTHIFPDSMAEKTIRYLSEKGQILPCSDGTVGGLLKRMEEAGVDLAITLPVLTNPAHFDHVNQYAASVNEELANARRRLISFAGIHPRCEEIEKKMAWIKKNGFLGVKIHPDYQDAFINDEGYIRILEAAKEEDLIVVTHAGADCAFRGQPVKCPPALALEVIRRVKHPKLVLAHYGGNEMADEVLEHLCGEDVYFDTSFVLKAIGEQTFRAILERHGEDKILFATDSPWSDIREDLAILQSFSLQKKTEEKLLCGNAKKLLGIS